MPMVPPVEDGAPPGAPKRRRARRAVLVAALLVIVLLAPIAVLLFVRGGGMPRGGPVAVPSAAPHVTPTGTGSPAAATSVPDTRTPTRVPPPDGRIAAGVLKNALLYVPPWPADNVAGPSGPVQFRNGLFTVPDRAVDEGTAWGKQIVIGAVTYGDVDRDGADETIAELECMIQGSSQQVVAFGRDRAGAVVTLGQVLATTGQVRSIAAGSIRVIANGDVAARVGDIQNCCGGTVPVTWQDRTYRWDGHRFHRSGGTAAIPLNPYVTETTVTAGELTLGPTVAGYRTGTLAVTVTHRWGTPPASVRLRFATTGGIEPTGPDWPSITDEPVGGYLVTVPAPAPLTAQTRQYAFRQPASVTGGQMTVAMMASWSAAGRSLAEAVPGSGATVAVHVTG
ncbi:hypothetical protein JCM9534A_02000 [Catenuloplanes indicus JCM 9534]